ncbi:MAG: ABC transporter ATP-binding protein [Gammaproteobacteria bacterium]|nr:ABC transporter ATP-binding protein [Gammaproteobacteria bacterium]
MLSIHELSYRYPGASGPALDRVSLTVPAGRIFGLLGPNGAGKTSLIGILAGLRSPGGGSLAWSGGARPRVALVPQEYAFYPSLSCRENLEFFADVQGVPQALRARRLELAMAFAGLEKVWAQRAGQYSGGLKRRLNLAIGLLADPDFLLLDEPTVGVDPQSRSFILEAIKALPAEGKTVLYTSHYMEEVQYLCESLAILDQGRVLAQGRLDALLASGDGSLGLRIPGAKEQAARAALAGAGVPVLARESGAQDLEALFMRLTHRSLRD